MERDVLSKVCSQVYRSHPEVDGARPKVQPLGDDQVLLIFTAKAKTENGHDISHNIRVVATLSGKIIKTTTSR